MVKMVKTKSIFVHRGYAVDEANPKTCKDINECATFGGHNCSQICINLEGTYACSCKAGFDLVEDRCVAQGKAGPVILYSDGPEIRSLESAAANQLQSSVVSGETRIQSVDYDPTTKIVYWADSYDLSIKRAVLPNLEDVSHGMAFSQDIKLKDAKSKPVDLAVDWVAKNLYWADVDASGMKPHGRILTSLLDGRYKRSLVTADLERPTSLVVDPEFGYALTFYCCCFSLVTLMCLIRLMIWADGGSSPKIESSWMDGTKRRAVVSEKLGTPSGLVVDYAAGHRLYWCDAKLNTIESINLDGSNRVTVAHGELHHPTSLDLFEDQLYWVTRDTGEIFKQDKFGRGVKVRVKRSLEQASDLKIYHEKKYNTSCKY